MSTFPLQEFVNDACEQLSKEYQEHNDQKQVEKDIREMAVDIVSANLEADGVVMSFQFTQSNEYIRFVRRVENMMRRQFGLRELA